VNRPASPITDTEFSTAGRQTATEILAQRQMFLGNGAVTAVLEALPEPVFVFNGLRQLLHANAPALRIVDQVGIDGAIGLRLGELLGCDHTVGSLEGCGGAAACANCVAISAMLQTTEGRTTEGSCELHLEKDGKVRAERFYARASPLHVPGQNLILLVLIPEKKKRSKKA
jgi:hypothetical protein